MKIKFGKEFIDCDLIYENEFTSLDDLWSEGSQNLFVDKKQLHIQCELGEERNIVNHQQQHVASVFFNRKFSGNLLISFQACSDNQNSKRNFNFFIHTKDNTNENLKITRDNRSGDYREYHQMQNYLITCLPSEQKNNDGTDKFRIRMRKNPGFELMNEIHEYACENFRWYQFSYLIRHKEVAISIDQKPELTFNLSDTTPLTEGYMGFRTFCSWLTYKDFKVYRVNI